MISKILNVIVIVMLVFLSVKLGENGEFVAAMIGIWCAVYIGYGPSSIYDSSDHINQKTKLQ